MSFQKAWDLARWLEGGLSDRADDPGRLTNEGMTQATWSGLGFPGSVADATPAQIEASFFKLWTLVMVGPVHLFDRIPEPADAVAFQLYINLPPAEFIKALQNAVGMMPSGKLDGDIIDAMKDLRGGELARNLLVAQREHYADKAKSVFIEGLEMRAQRAEIWLLQNS